jgi:twinkle protein
LKDHQNSSFVCHEPCPKCGSSDALARYSDGHGYCWSCRAYEAPSADATPNNRKATKRMAGDLIPMGDVAPLLARKITEETAAKWRYTRSTFKDKTVQVANYFDDEGTLVAQKLRFKTAPGEKKDMTTRGDLKAAGLYGKWLWRDRGKMIVITEGEIDALSVSQVQANKWPVVSVPNGAQGAAKSISENLEWLLGFETIILMLDNDEHGNAAVKECAPLFPPGRVKIARLPLKDANDMLKAGRGAEIVDAIWGAKVWRPDGIVRVSDIKADALMPIQRGLPWFLPKMTEWTYGRRYGEAYALGAGTGVGKTELFTHQIEYDINTLKQPVALFFLEQEPKETLLRVAGKFKGKPFHIPDEGWTQEELAEALDELEKTDRLILYNHFGSIDWDEIRDRMRFLRHSENVRLFYLDHLTALAAHDPENERTLLEKVMGEIGSLVKELGIVLHFISHLTTPEGKSHEEGGRVTIRQFKGARAIGFWSHFMFGLERDQQADSPEARATTILRCLKDRYTGRSTGLTAALRYNRDACRLEEAPDDGCPFPSADDDCPF